jgi:hypothetical protein
MKNFWNVLRLKSFVAKLISTLKSNNAVTPLADSVLAIHPKASRYIYVLAPHTEAFE